MKIISYIILVLIFILSIGCNPIVAQPQPGVITETVIETVAETVEVENTDRIEILENEIKQYQDLICNLNEYLNNIYYCYNDNGTYIVWGTGFSLQYNDKYYLITAGHAVMQDGDYHPNLGFKNYKNEWIYPKLLKYEATETTPDYAIFYSDKVNEGLGYDLSNTEPDYRLGVDISIEENNTWGETGSCGSPVIDQDGEVMGLHVGYFQDIDEVLNAIDSIE